MAQLAVGLAQPAVELAQPAVELAQLAVELAQLPTGGQAGYKGIESYRWMAQPAICLAQPAIWWGGGLCDFSVIPSPIGL